MPSPEEKIRNLIAKAISTEIEFPEEARTCALTAVRMIVRYEIQLRLPDVSARGEEEEEEEAAPPPRQSSGKYQRVDFSMDDDDDDESGEDFDGREITTRYATWCRSCGGSISKGRTVWWRGPGRGVLCSRCGPE